MRERILSWIEDNRGELIDFLKKFINYRSPTGKEKEVQKEFVEPFLSEEMEWDEVEIVDVSEKSDRPNVNAFLDGEGDGRDLLFNGHVDVVDVSDEERKKWDKDPWEPVIKNSRIYGRGSNDMKGGDTAAIWASKAIMENDISLKGSLMLSLVVGEEENQQEYGAIPATNSLPEKVDKEPFCVNAEPTNNEIYVKTAANFDFKIKINGKETHACQKNLTRHPQRYGLPVGKEIGEDASKIMSEVLERLQELEDQWNLRYRDELYGGGGYPKPGDSQGVGPFTICPTIIRAGSQICTIPGTAEIQRLVVFDPDLASDEVLWNEIKDVVRGISATNDWLKDNPMELKWKESSDWPASKVSMEHSGVQTLGTSVKEATEREPIFSAFKANTDTAYLQSECGVDSISMGPGALHMGTHGPDEYVPVEQLIEATKVYAMMILNWCGVKES